MCFMPKPTIYFPVPISLSSKQEGGYFSFLRSHTGAKQSSISLLYNFLNTVLRYSPITNKRFIAVLNIFDKTSKQEIYNNLPFFSFSQSNYTQQFNISSLFKKMKAIKVKKLTNNSFVTNHDLLECLRNKSFVATRQNSTRLHTTKSKVSLLEKKSYDRLHTLQENNSMVANTSQFMPSVADKAVILVQDCITSLGEGNQKIAHKLKKALAYIREIHEEHQREEESRQKIEKEGEKALLRKLEASYQEKAVLKIQNEEFKNKLAEYREKLNLLRKEKKEKEKEITTNPSLKNAMRQDELHELIINQNELIDRQTQQNKQREEQLQRVLKIQALQIQEMMKRKPPIGPNPRML